VPTARVIFTVVCHERTLTRRTDTCQLYPLGGMSH
jgi:hypothetical protein